ncbi:steroidogenic acute regulatory protein, mitochondrial [Caerostris extrusa]|uniref:Steroidogenic acute regulatory protein, mitochondrial n=1 Tax=Caerostris extrusa TaxID=172846 RepID=A0AAV4MMC2_CAEEX|nr:steroidogenic acute regulatory protein, mitochondrial [Caerostris extrusa]
MLNTIGNWIFQRKPTPKPSPPISLQENDYQKLAEDALKKAIAILEADDWKKEKSYGNDTIYSKIVPPYGKVFKFEGILNVPPKKVLEILYNRAEEMHKWNPTVKRVKIIKKIDDFCDIAHVIATEGAAGLVSSSTSEGTTCPLGSEVGEGSCPYFYTTLHHYHIRASAKHQVRK